MNTKKKAVFIHSVDGDIQELHSGDILDKWKRLITPLYERAIGKGYGWVGISDEDPEVIEELFPKVIEFIGEHRIYDRR